MSTKKTYLYKQNIDDNELLIGEYEVYLNDNGVDNNMPAKYRVNSDLDKEYVEKYIFDKELLEDSDNHNMFLEDRINNCKVDENGYIGYFNDNVNLYDKDIVEDNKKM